MLASFTPPSRQVVFSGGQSARGVATRTIPFIRGAPPMPARTVRGSRTNLQYYQSRFLGPKNYKGEYYRNKYYYPPTNHTPKYLTPARDQYNPLIDPEKPAQKSYLNVRPFPQNPHNRTNTLVGDSLRHEIYDRVVVKNESITSVAQSLRMQMPRIEAIVKLVEIENEWKAKEKAGPQLQIFADTMKKMFPLHSSFYTPENLTEIPTQKETQKTMLLTIAESEPFGPTEAAEMFEIEEAAKTLKRLTETGTHADTKSQKKVEIYYGPVLEGERAAFRFMKARVGKVGYRYGASRDDTKKNRGLVFDRFGKIHYTPPVET